MSYYKGYASQRGRGLGNVLGGIFRAAVPWIGKTLKGAAKAAGHALLESGLNALDGTPKAAKPKPYKKQRRKGPATISASDYRGVTSKKRRSYPRDLFDKKRN